MNITYIRVFLGILGHYSIQYLNFAKKWFNSLFNSKNFKKIQFKKIFNSKICKKIQFKKIFNSKICNSKKYSIQKFAKKFNSKFDSKCWMWQDSIQQYIHSITKHGYRSPLVTTVRYFSSFFSELLHTEVGNLKMLANASLGIRNNSRPQQSGFCGKLKRWWKLLIFSRWWWSERRTIE